MRTAILTSLTLRLTLLALVLCLLPASSDAAEYASSVVGTDFDFIQESDPSAFLCLEFKGRGTREMPDKRGPTPLYQEAFIFVSYYSDGTSVDMALDAAFETEERAREEARRYTPRLGRLPTSLRHGVKRMVIHRGGKDTTAFSDVGLIVLYSAKATKRISTHDLEETVFHESVHASWDKQHARSAAWRAAQKADGTFITRYAERKPIGEDLAESALFAYTLLHHPERIPAADAARIRRAIPARIAFVEKLLPPGQPILVQVAPPYACDGSGTTFTVTAPEDEPTMNPDPPQEEEPPVPCRIDLARVGTLSDIISNALMHGLEQKESAVFQFLSKAKVECATSDALLEATAKEFGFDRSTLNAQVREFYHCNCDHGALADDPALSAALIDNRVPPPAAPEQTHATEERAPSAALPAESLRPFLYVIVALLLALLTVSTMTLALLRRQGRAQAER